MNTCCAPIEDLLAYIQEEYTNNPYKKYSGDIIDIIDNHYFKLTEYHLKPIVPQLVLPELCFGDYGTKEAEWKEFPGMLIQSKLGRFGITFNRQKEKIKGQTGGLGIWFITPEGRLIEEPYNSERCEACGLMTKFYNYPDYEKNCDLQLGCRIINLYDNGPDVISLQIILKKFIPDLDITGTYDQQTKDAYIKAQKAFGTKTPVEYYNPNRDEVVSAICGVKFYGIRA